MAGKGVVIFGIDLSEIPIFGGIIDTIFKNHGAEYNIHSVNRFIIHTMVFGAGTGI